MFTCANIRIAATFLDRARGLLFTHRVDLAADTLVLIPCKSVHTLGMRFAIDVAFVSKDGQVLRVDRAVRPGALWLSHPLACAVIERAASPGAWLTEGSSVAFSTVSQPADPRVQPRK